MKFHSRKWQISWGLSWKMQPPARAIPALVCLAARQVLTRCGWEGLLGYFWPFLSCGMMRACWKVIILLQCWSFLSRGSSYNRIKRLGFYILLLKGAQQCNRTKTSLCAASEQNHVCGAFLVLAKLFILPWKSGILFSYNLTCPTSLEI